MKKRLPIIVIILVIVVGLLAVRMKRMKQKNSSPLLKSAPMTVQTVKVDRQTISSGRHVFLCVALNYLFSPIVMGVCHIF